MVQARVTVEAPNLGPNQDALLRKRPRRKSEWQLFVAQNRDELLSTLGVGKSLIEPGLPLFSTHPVSYEPTRIARKPYFFTRAQDHIFIAPDVVLHSENYIIIPRLLMSVEITSASLEDMEDQYSYERELAENVTRAVSKYYKHRNVAVELGGFHSGSIDFVLGVGFAATLSAAFNILKDYPNFKKGCKELKDDVIQISKTVTKRFIRQDRDTGG